ncbi:MAG: cytochrome d ubiquinol oxidase subunit II [Verrucomicrobia bacterium]|nr:cytochrome d ubiquinol oxidase subunit II [Verrucomicrobiota bacterium]
MDLNTTWFILVGVLIGGYAILDGFDLGVGVIHLFTRNEHERRVNLNAIGPVWDGNEVWLLTGGGALFAAFPIVYATVFSAFYMALMLLLVALIFRAVSLEFRGKVDAPAWKRFWDWAFGLGSLVPALLFGVAVGNIARGIPLDSEGMYTGGFFNLLNPYALLAGALSLVMCVMHGAAYLSMKSEGDQRRRMRKWLSRTWIAFAALYACVLIATYFAAPFLLYGVSKSPLLLALLIILMAGLVFIPIASGANRDGRAFLASAVTILATVGLFAVCLFPRLVPSCTDLANSLTIYNAASTPRTHRVMLIIALVGMPLVIGYSAVIYRVFKGKVVLTEDSY